MVMTLKLNLQRLSYEFHRNDQVDSRNRAQFEVINPLRLFNKTLTFSPKLRTVTKYMTTNFRNLFQRNVFWGSFKLAQYQRNLPESKI